MAAKWLGIGSMIMFFLTLSGGVIALAVTVAAAVAAVNSPAGTYRSTTTVTVSAFNSNPASYYISLKTSSVGISTSGVWQSRLFPSGTTADGYTSGGQCGASCQRSASYRLRLVARCGSGSWTDIGSSGTMYCSGSTLYLVANDASGNYGLNSGSITVSIAEYS
eukprot:TRINITY_DN5714_c1_g2_i1.p2 TRINITY_DN5714_c1_g2~~TRINITY_DN5714_c1_g2_i1.p2  ORF type:complete len:164 (+),score=52.05 TRINITY_DN5714_c1_g2_i1:993-1484(+)